MRWSPLNPGNVGGGKPCIGKMLRRSDTGAETAERDEVRLGRMRWLILAAVVGLGAVLALGVPRLVGPVLGQNPVVRVASPDSVSVGENVAVGINVESVTGLGAYEWVLTYDPDVLELAGGDNPVNGSFLGSTGRSVFCPSAIPDVGSVRFGCVSSGGGAPPNGSGVLSTVTFTALASGGSSLCIRWATLADEYGDDIPAGVVHDSIVVGGSSPPPPSCPPPATPTPPSAPPGTIAPHPPLDTPVSPLPTMPATATAPPSPAPPTPTPEPTPPPESAEVLDLIAGCNPVASTYHDGTTVQTLAAAIAPPETLEAIWKFAGGAWLGYSPEFPQASNLAVVAFLDVVFLCVDAPSTFVRPLV